MRGVEWNYENIPLFLLFIYAFQMNEKITSKGPYYKEKGKAALIGMV